ncbi:MAG: acetylxylan esterase [Flavitalea sp.]
MKKNTERRPRRINVLLHQRGKALLTMLIVVFCLSSIFAYAERAPIYSTENYVIAEDSLPNVLPAGHSDLTALALINEAAIRFSLLQLPDNIKEWEQYRLKTKKEMIEKAGVQINTRLPLDIRETASIPMKGYTIKNISFQTRPGVRGTGSLYVPDGKGPFPAVIVMHGHWPDGHANDLFQSVASSVALNGYVSLTIDAFGGGERSTVHGKDEYHGNNLGASCMNIGESLMGIQISDNMRGVDLLCSLPYVDAKHIGATGASGGGNQTMWLTAIDDRIKAAVPVVSVGTFETYIMKDNCICELMVDGLNFTEESGVLALVAPRAIKMCNHLKDNNPTFAPAEMLRSYNNALPVFKMLGVEKNLSYQLFDLPHTYDILDREAMLGWFDHHLKGIGDGSPKKETPFTLLPVEQLKVFPVGKRNAEVISVAEYCQRQGAVLRKDLLNAKSFNIAVKKKELRDILRTEQTPLLQKVNQYSKTAEWERFALETSDGKIIPVIIFPPVNSANEYTIFADPKGKSNIDLSLVEAEKQKGKGIVVVDLSGTGENGNAGEVLDSSFSFHTLSRSDLWLGKTILGEWSKELSTVTAFLGSRYHDPEITINARGTAALAALFMSASKTIPTGKKNNISGIILRDAPVSYLFDDREMIDFFTMAAHLPRFLNWGDISLAAALSQTNISFINPLTMSGREIPATLMEAYKSEFKKINAISRSPGKTIFK